MSWWDCPCIDSKSLAVRLLCLLGCEHQLCVCCVCMCAHVCVHMSVCTFVCACLCVYTVCMQHMLYSYGKRKAHFITNDNAYAYVHYSILTFWRARFFQRVYTHVHSHTETYGPLHNKTSTKTKHNYNKQSIITHYMISSDDQ